MSSETVDIKTLDEAGCEALAQSLGHPAYRGRQLFQWVFGKGMTDLATMSNLPAAFRASVEEKCRIGSLQEVNRMEARDKTTKFLFKLESGRFIETVLIPDFKKDGAVNRLTVCVSSQVGCAMDCSFCATGKMGFQQNLHAGEIYEQVWLINEFAKTLYGRGITNIVYMGMGEPLLNYDQVIKSIGLLTHKETLGLSPKRITVSTVGLARRIRQLADDQTAFNLAVSLHAPTDEQRSAIMPVNRNERTDLNALKEAIQYYTRTLQKKITYEYCMFEGVNDSVQDARNLAKIVSWADSKVNLIMYNPVPGLGFERSSETRLNAFVQELVKKNVLVTVRRSRGQDIAAACGQLAVNTVKV